MDAPRSRTRVIVVDDSSLSRAILQRILEADGDIEVVAQGTNGLEALPLIQQFKPDLVTMDIDMPGSNGLETIERVMRTSPVPILVITSERLGPESDVGFRAVQLGALDFTAKPAITDPASTEALRSQVRKLSKVPVFIHTADEPVSKSLERPLAVEPLALRRSVIAIASGSGGGSKVLASIVRALPANFGCPILVVQHHPEQFSRAFAKFLQSMTALPVRVVEGMPYEFGPGEVLVCGTDAHLFVPHRGVAVANFAPPVSGHRPSATVLFESVAEAYGASAIGLVLSGTGEDGLAGLAALHRAGALTLAERTSPGVIGDLPSPSVATGTNARPVPTEMLADYLMANVLYDSAKTTAPPSYGTIPVRNE